MGTGQEEEGKRGKAKEEGVPFSERVNVGFLPTGDEKGNCRE